MEAERVEVLVYDPALQELEFFWSEFVKDIKKFKLRSGIIVANRQPTELNDSCSKVFTRDIFNKD